MFYYTPILILSQHNKSTVPLWALLKLYIQEDSWLSLYPLHPSFFFGTLIESLSDKIII